MTWRGSITIQDRIFACLPYLLPLIEVITLQSIICQLSPTCFPPNFPRLIDQLPIINQLVQIYNVPYMGLIVFFALFILVVRNEKINHFIRFNTMQAILLDIIIFLLRVLINVVGVIDIAGFATQTLSTIIFIGIMVAVTYSVFQSLLGRYAEIPSISDAVYTQVR